MYFNISSVNDIYKLDNSFFNSNNMQLLLNNVRRGFKDSPDISEEYKIYNAIIHRALENEVSIKYLRIILDNYNINIENPYITDYIKYKVF
jgi:hypothetical protein